MYAYVSTSNIIAPMNINIACIKNGTTSISRTKKIEMLDEDKILNENVIPPENDKKNQDAEISEEMIENLLKDDSAGDDDTQNIQSLNTSDEIKDVLSKKD